MIDHSRPNPPRKTIRPTPSTTALWGWSKGGIPIDEGVSSLPGSVVWVGERTERREETPWWSRRGKGEKKLPGGPGEGERMDDGDVGMDTTAVCMEEEGRERERNVHDPQVMAALGPYLGEKELDALERTCRTSRDALRRDAGIWIDLYRKRWKQVPWNDRGNVEEEWNARKRFLQRIEDTKKWKFADPKVHLGEGKHSARPGGAKNKGTRVKVVASTRVVVTCRDTYVLMNAVDDSHLVVQERRSHADAIACLETWAGKDGQGGTAIGGRDGGVKTILQGNRPKILRGHTKKVTCIKAGPEEIPCILATGSGDSTIVLWNVPEGGDPAKITKKAIMRGHGEAIVHLAWSGPYLVSAGADGKVKLWDVDKVQCKQTAKFPAPIKFMKGVGQGGVVLATAKTFVVLAPGELRERYTFAGENFLSMDAACVHGMPVFAIGRENGSVKIWDCERKEPCTLAFSDANTPVSHLKIDGGKVVAASKASSTIKVWELPGMGVIHDDVFGCIARQVQLDTVGTLTFQDLGSASIQDVDAKGSVLAALVTWEEDETALVVASFEQSFQRLNGQSEYVQGSVKSKFWQYEQYDEDMCGFVVD